MLPNEAIDAASRNLDHLWGNRDNLGFFLVNKGQSQLAYTCINSINTYLETHPYMNISLYTVQSVPSVSICKFGVFNLIEAKNHVGPLVCCDPISLQNAVIAKRAKIYYYAYDPLFLRNNDEIQKIIIRNKIPIILRHAEHGKFMKDFTNIAPIDTIVEDFDVAKLLEIINVD